MTRQDRFNRVIGSLKTRFQRMLADAIPSSGYCATTAATPAVFSADRDIGWSWMSGPG